MKVGRESDITAVATISRGPVQIGDGIGNVDVELVNKKSQLEWQVTTGKQFQPMVRLIFPGYFFSLNLPSTGSFITTESNSTIATLQDFSRLEPISLRAPSIWDFNLW